MGSFRAERASAVSAENWHEERDRLVRLLLAVDAGTITHIDGDNVGQLQPIDPENVRAIRRRLEQLNARLD